MTRSSSSTKHTRSAPSGREGAASVQPRPSSPTFSSERLERPSRRPVDSWRAAGFSGSSWSIVPEASSSPPPCRHRSPPRLSRPSGSSTAQRGTGAGRCSVPTPTAWRHAWPSLHQSRPGSGERREPGRDRGRQSHPAVHRRERRRCARSFRACWPTAKSSCRRSDPRRSRLDSARLRITLSASHTPADLDRLIDALGPPREPASAADEASSSPGPTPASVRPSSRSPFSRLARRRGLTAIPFKPAETGCDPHPADARSLWLAARPPVAEATSAVRLPVAGSPAQAAAAEGAHIDLQRIADRARALAAKGDLLIVEGAGGLLVPYADDVTTADIAARLRLPCWSWPEPGSAQSTTVPSR